MRTQLAVPDNDLVGPRYLQQLFTLHGSMMMFPLRVADCSRRVVDHPAAAIAGRARPAISPPVGLWLLVLPDRRAVRTGDRSSSMPPPDGGWFMYPPLTTRTDPVGARSRYWMLGLFLHRGVVGRRRSRTDRRRAQMSTAGHAAQSHAAICLVTYWLWRDDPLCLSAAHRRRHIVSKWRGCSTGPSSMRAGAGSAPVAASVLDLSVIRSFTSYSCLRSRCSRCWCRPSPNPISWAIRGSCCPLWVPHSGPSACGSTTVHHRLPRSASPSSRLPPKPWSFDRRPIFGRS